PTITATSGGGKEFAFCAFPTDWQPERTKVSKGRLTQRNQRPIFIIEPPHRVSGDSASTGGDAEMNWLDAINPGSVIPVADSHVNARSLQRLREDAQIAASIVVRINDLRMESAHG